MRVVQGCALVVLMMAGCVRDELVDCGDGRSCPAGWTCELEYATCVAPGALAVAPDPIELLDIPCGTTAMRTIVVRNPGTEPVELTTRTTLAVLAVAPTQATVPPGGELELAVTLDVGATTAPGSVSTGEVLLTTPRDTVVRPVRFSLAGALVTASSTVDLGETPANGTEVRTFTVRNAGTTTTELDISNVTGAFSILSELPVALEPNAQREVVVRFAPGGVVGDYNQTAQLSLSGVQCQPPPTSLQLSARASGDAMLASNTLVDFAPGACGAPSTDYTLTLTSQVSYEQQVSVSIVGDAQEITFAGGGTLPPAPGKLVVRLTRPPLVAPRAVGSFTTVLQVVATGQADEVTKLIPVSYAVHAPVLITSASTLPALPNTMADFEVSNVGNRDAYVKFDEGTLMKAEAQRVAVRPTEFDVEIGELQPIEVRFASEYVPPMPPDQALVLKLDAEGQCGGPLQLAVVPVATAP